MINLYSKKRKGKRNKQTKKKQTISCQSDGAESDCYGSMDESVTMLLPVDIDPLPRRLLDVDARFLDKRISVEEVTSENKSQLLRTGYSMLFG